MVNEYTEGLTKLYESLRKKLSDLRKTGADVKIAELKLGNIPSKIKYADITEERKDFQKVKYLLDEAEDELNEIEKEFGLFDENKAPDEKKEASIEKPKTTRKMDMHSPLSDCWEHIKKKDRVKAIDSYKKVQKVYIKLSKREKKEIMPDCLALMNEIKRMK